jgi:hypothetical protein
MLTSDLSTAVRSACHDRSGLPLLLYDHTSARARSRSFAPARAWIAGSLRFNVADLFLSASRVTVLLYATTLTKKKSLGPM